MLMQQALDIKNDLVSVHSCKSYKEVGNFDIYFLKTVLSGSYFLKEDPVI